MCLAIPGEIVRIVDDHPLTRLGKVRFGKVLKSVNLMLVPETKVGDFVLVHAGFALTKLDIEAAAEVFRTLEQLP